MLNYLSINFVGTGVIQTVVHHHWCSTNYSIRFFVIIFSHLLFYYLTMMIFFFFFFNPPGLCNVIYFYCTNTKICIFLKKNTFIFIRFYGGTTYFHCVIWNNIGTGWNETRVQQCMAKQFYFKIVAIFVFFFFFWH